MFKTSKAQKQPPEVFFRKRCSQKCPCRPQPATLLEKRLWHRCFPVNFAHFQEHLFYRTPLGECFGKLIFPKSNRALRQDKLNLEMPKSNQVSFGTKSHQGLFQKIRACVRYNQKRARNSSERAQLWIFPPYFQGIQNGTAP